jgi:23S rRNA pseudouridine2605 synthase
MTERLQKILAQWGIASRRQAEQMIVDGRVHVNGHVAQLGQKADPTLDHIAVDGTLIRPNQRPQPVYLLLHKPLGIVSTCDDPQGRPTVLDLLSPDLRNHSGIHPVGRLDVDSTGALLLTNDGDVTFWLTHPRHSIAKTYHVWVKGQPTTAVLDQWRHGVWLEGRRTRPAKVRILTLQPPTQTLLEIELREGRNRQIRKIADQLGHPVLRLCRVAIGPIRLDGLPYGQYRPLTSTEIEFLHPVEQTKPSISTSVIGERAISRATGL